MQLAAGIIQNEVHDPVTAGINYEFLYRQYSKAMFNVALRIVNNTPDAEDILQESFIDAFRKIDTLEHHGSFGAWLKRIVINKSINKINRTKFRFLDIEIANVYAIAGEEYEEKDDPELKVETIKQAIQQLPDGYRTIICLKLLEGYKHEDIAEILKISPGTVRTQYIRAKRKVLEILKQKSHE